MANSSIVRKAKNRIIKEISELDERETLINEIKKFAF